MTATATAPVAVAVAVAVTVAVTVMAKPQCLPVPRTAKDTLGWVATAMLMVKPILLPIAKMSTKDQKDLCPLLTGEAIDSNSILPGLDIEARAVLILHFDPPVAPQPFD